jgi:hypothetical protein
MITRIGDWWLLNLKSVVVGVLLCGSGCGSNSDIPTAMPEAQVVAQLRQAFQPGPATLRNCALDAGSAYGSNDLARTFTLLHTLAGSPNLSPAQRAVVARCTLTVNEKLQASAAQGQADASQTLKLYRSDK